MQSNQKSQTRVWRHRQIIWRRFCGNLRHRPWLAVLALLLILAAIGCILWVAIPLPGNNDRLILHILWKWTIKLAALLLAALCSIALLTAAPPKAAQWTAAFTGIGFVDAFGCSPALVDRYKIGRAECMIFYSPGISLETWVQQKSAIEDALNRSLLQPEYAYHNRHFIQLTGKIGAPSAKTMDLWDDEL